MFDCNFASKIAAVDNSLVKLCPSGAILDYAASRCCEIGLVTMYCTTYILLHLNQSY